MAMHFFRVIFSGKKTRLSLQSRPGEQKGRMDAYPKEGFFIGKGRKSSVEYEGRKALFDSGVGARPTGKSLKFPSPPPPSLPKKKEERRPPSSASSFDDGDRSASLRLGLPTRIERAKFVPSHRRWRVRRKQGEGMDALWANRFFFTGGESGAERPLPPKYISLAKVLFCNCSGGRVGRQTGTRERGYLEK